MSDSQLIGKRLRGYTITEQLGTPKEDWVVLRGTSPQGNIVFKLLWNHIQAQTFQRFQREISTHEELSEFNSNASRGGIAVFEDRIQPDELVGPFAGFQDGFAIRFYPRSLRDVIAGDLTFSERLKIAIGLAESVGIAHQVRVHRDIKPENFLLDETLKPFLTDFGATGPRIQNGKPYTVANVTGKSGKHPHSPPYAAPEQLMVRQYADERSDLYSLGLVLYELFAEHPFLGPRSLLSTGSKQLSDDIGPPSKESRVGLEDGTQRQWNGIDAVCLKLMKVAPGKRLANARLVVQLLCRIEAGKRVQVDFSVRKRLAFLCCLTISALTLFLTLRRDVVSAVKLPVEESAVFIARINPVEEHLIACAFHKGSIQIIDTDTKKIVAEIHDRLAYRPRLDWSPDGEGLLIGSCNGALYSWSAHEKTAPKIIHEKHAYYVQDVECSPDGRFVASMDRSGDVLVYEQLNKKLVGRYQVPAGVAGADTHGLSVTWEADSVHLLVAGGGWYDHLSRWNVLSNQSQTIFEQLRGNFSLRQVECSPHDSIAAVTRVLRGDMRGNHDQTNFCEIVLLRTDTGEVISGPTDLTSKVSRTGAVRSVHWRDADTVLIYTDEDITCYSADSSEVLADYPGDLKAVDWSNTRIVGVTQTGGLEAYELQSTGLYQILSNPPVKPISVSGLASFADGFVVSDSTGHTHIWSAGQFREFSEGAVLRFMAIRPGTDLVATCGQSGSICLRNILTGVIEAELHVEGRAERLVWSPDGRFLACGTDSGELQILICNADSSLQPTWRFGRSTFDPENHSLAIDVKAIAWRSNDSLLCSASVERRESQLWQIGVDGTAEQWTTKTLQGSPAIVDHVSDIQFFNDGSFIIPSHYGVAGYWDSRGTNRQIRTAARYTSLTSTCIVDDNYAALTAGDGSLWQWSRITGTCRKVMAADGVELTSSAYDSDSKMLLVVDALGRLTLLSGPDLESVLQLETQVIQPTAIVILKSNRCLVGGAHGTIAMIDLFEGNIVTTWQLTRQGINTLIE